MPSVNTAAFCGIYLGRRPFSGKPTVRPVVYLNMELFDQAARCRNKPQNTERRQVFEIKGFPVAC